MPLWDDDKESVWMLPGYLEGIHQAGGVPVIIYMMRRSFGIWMVLINEESF